MLGVQLGTGRQSLRTHVRRRRDLMVGQSCVHRLMGQAETIGRDRPCPPRPPRSAVTTVIAVIRRRRDPSKWRQGPCPGGAVPSALPCARVVRSFVGTPWRRPEELRTNNVRQGGGLPRARYHACQVEIMRGCHVSADPLDPHLTSGRRRRSLQCRLFVVRFDQHRGVRVDREVHVRRAYRS